MLEDDRISFLPRSVNRYKRTRQDHAASTVLQPKRPNQPPTDYPVHHVVACKYTTNARNQRFEPHHLMSDFDSLVPFCCAYVDIPQRADGCPDRDLFIRCVSAKHARKLVNSLLGLSLAPHEAEKRISVLITKVALLEGEEEQLYWKQVPERVQHRAQRQAVLHSMRRQPRRRKKIRSKPRYDGMSAL